MAAARIFYQLSCVSLRTIDEPLLAVRRGRLHPFREEVGFRKQVVDRIELGV